MMEKIKTIALTVLVTASLVQTYLLAYSTPTFDPIRQTKYVQTELVGTQAKLEDVVFPQDIILHYGNDKHTVFYPDTEFYKIIFQLVKQRTFDGLRLASGLSINWNSYRNDRQGVEIRFPEGIPLSVLQKMMQIKGDNLFGNEAIQTIWILADKDKEQVRTFFFTKGGAVYEAMKVDLIVKDVENFVGFGELQPKYHMSDGKYYVPEQPLQLMSFRIPYSQYTAEQLRSSLFVDPGITRNLKERDGTEIYTDGKRGLQLKRELHWMSYSDPSISSVGTSIDLREDLLTAIQFINQHGGWNGHYMISSVTDRYAQERTFTFRQYVDSGVSSMPVVSPYLARFGYIEVVLQKGVVSNYERSLINMDRAKSEVHEAMLPSGQTLERMIRNFGARSSKIQSVFPAYRADILEGYIDFQPAWAVNMKDGGVEFLDQGF